MPKDYSPFTPGIPVPVEFFVGRLDEVNQVKEKVASATAGRLQVAFLSGERGIGKSSLASFVRFITERDNQVLGIHTFLGGVTLLEEMVRRVFDRLLKESVGKTWHEKVRQFFGNHIREVGLFGVSVEFGASMRELDRMAHDFAPSLRRLVERLREEKKGIFLILDDINGLAGSAEFANWLKSLVDEIATSSEPLPLCLLAVGLEERRQSLISLQPSLARVFDLVEIEAWTYDETRTFYETAFSKVGMSIDQDALRTLGDYAGGLPVLAHEIGDAVFKFDRDGHINNDDAVNGVINAAEIIGRKHLEPRVFQAIRSPRYRTILRQLTRAPFGVEFQRSEVLKHLSGDEIKVLDNFLRRMQQLGVLTKNPERGPGAYRFANILHYVYFFLEARRAKRIEA